MQQDFDVLIAGAGQAGSLAALALARQGWRIALIDPRPSFKAEAIIDHGRTAAIMNDGLDFLSALGLLAPIQDRCAPLKKMRLIDGIGARSGKPDIITFDAREIGLEAFALNIPNAPLLAETFAALADEPSVTACEGRKLAAIDARDEGNVVTLDDGQVLSGRLLIGADGKTSFVRQTLGFANHKRATDRLTFTLAVTHSLPHNFVSTEFHYDDGPLTLVPMPGQESAVVWSHNPDRAAELQAAAPEAFLAALQHATHGILGRLKLSLPPVAVAQEPVLTRAYVKGRCALMAEAAHALPPIGAQGLNLSIGDVQALADAMLGMEDPGAAPALARYQARRLPDARFRFYGTNALDLITTSHRAPVRHLQKMGLQSLRSSATLRQLAMRAGSRPLRLPSLF